jgi:hypothetical protein
MARVKRTKSVSVIKHSEVMSEAEKERLEVERERLIPVTEFKTYAERIAKSTVFFKNFYVPEMEKVYKHHERFRRIDKVFPFARLGDGPETCKLLVDEPNNEFETDHCVKKAMILKELGYKYCFIEKDADILGVLQQLGVY